MPRWITVSRCSSQRQCLNIAAPQGRQAALWHCKASKLAAISINPCRCGCDQLRRGSGDDHVIHAGFYQAGAAGVCGFDQDVHRLPGVAADVGGEGRPGSIVVVRGAQLLQHGGRGSADDLDAQVVRRGRVVTVRQVVLERQGQGAPGGQDDIGRADGGRAAVDIIGASVVARQRTGHQVVGAADRGAHLLGAAAAGDLRIGALPHAERSGIGAAGVARPAQAGLEVIREDGQRAGRRDGDRHAGCGRVQLAIVDLEGEAVAPE